MRQALVCNFILIRPHRNNINFNRQHLPSFYKLLLACCQHSASFIEYLMEANEFIPEQFEDEDEDWDGQPDEAQEWYDFDPEC